MKITRLLVITAAAVVLVWTGLPAAAQKTAPAATQPAASEIQILKMVVCKDVKDRDPQDELTTAKAGDIVVGWTQIKSAADATITHRWVLDGKTVKEFPLQIKASSGYRSWSKKTVAHPGNWKFQVIDAGGNVLKEIAFTVS